MKLALELGGFRLELETATSAMGRHLDMSVETPWWDGGLETGYNRAKSLKVCLSCGKVAKKCECEEGVWTTADQVSDSLNEMAHQMFHWMTGTVHGESDDDELD